MRRAHGLLECLRRRYGSEVSLRRYEISRAVHNHKSQFPAQRIGLSLPFRPAVFVVWLRVEEWGKRADHANLSVYWAQMA